MGSWLSQILTGNSDPNAVTVPLYPDSVTIPLSEPSAEEKILGAKQRPTPSVLEMIRRKDLQKSQEAFNANYPADRGQWGQQAMDRMGATANDIRQNVGQAAQDVGTWIKPKEPHFVATPSLYDAMAALPGKQEAMAAQQPVPLSQQPGPRPQGKAIPVTAGFILSSGNDPAMDIQGFAQIGVNFDTAKALLETKYGRNLDWGSLKSDWDALYVARPERPDGKLNDEDLRSLMLTPDVPSGYLLQRGPGGGFVAKPSDELIQRENAPPPDPYLVMRQSGQKNIPYQQALKEAQKVSPNSFGKEINSIEGRN